jgi:hypothetical protein
MHDGLLETAIMGLGGVLLAFELAVAMGALITSRRGPTRATRFGRLPMPIGRTVWVSTAAAVRAHLTERRRQLVELRSRFEPMRSARYGRDLRSSIRHRPLVNPRPLRTHVRV